MPNGDSKAPLIIAFLVSDIFDIIPVRKLANGVNNAFASSKSPNINLHVWPHPDCTASFNTSHNCVNVFTFVAASSAVFANSNASCISLAFLPDFSANALDAYLIASASPYLALALSNVFSIASLDNPVYSATYSLAPEVVNFFNVFVRTSDVSHPVCKDSLNEPFAFIAASAPVLSSLEVSFNAFWNTCPPMPALTTEFQSCNLIVPAAKA